MKRKVIQIAGSTQLVSLPRAWALAQGIKKGDEVEVDTNGSNMTISAKAAQPEVERAEIDITNLGVLARMLIGALYKGGYDEIKVNFSHPDELMHVHDVLTDYCVGFEIVEQGKNFVIARKISDTIYAEFDVMLRRTFLFINAMASEGLDAIKNKDIAALNKVVIIDSSINKFNFFCRRVLNKMGREGSHKKTSSLYFIVDILEEIADGYKELYRLLIEKKLRMNKESIAVLQQTNALLELFYDMFYKFELEKMQQFMDGCKLWENIMEKAFKSTANKDDMRILVKLNSMYDKIICLDGPLLLFRYTPS